MKIEKAKLSRAISKLKNVVPKMTAAMALQGMLVKDGYLIANNMEMAVRMRLEGSDGESFIIPTKAFELIANLPDGEVNLIPEEKESYFTITIKTGRIKNTYQTFSPDDFPLPNMTGTEGEAFTVDSGQLITSMRRVIYSIPADEKTMMGCMSLQAENGTFNLAGMDGHMLAWDKIFTDGALDILVPRITIEKLLSLGLSGECTIKSNPNGAIFQTADYDIFTRIRDGSYFKYKKMFEKGPLNTVIDKQKLLDAVTRAKMCCANTMAIRMAYAGEDLTISIADNNSDYVEVVRLESPIDKAFTIGFDARLMIETLKSFDCDQVALTFTSEKVPMLIEADNSEFQAVIAPVNIGN